MKHDCNHHPAQRPRQGAAWVARYRASGLSLKDFAREQGLSAGRLHYWLYQKHRGVPPRRSPGSLGASRVPGFREIKLPSAAPPLLSWAAEVNLPQGLVVRFQMAAEPGWVGAVVQALQRPC